MTSSHAFMIYICPNYKLFIIQIRFIIDIDLMLVLNIHYTNPYIKNKRLVLFIWTDNQTYVYFILQIKRVFISSEQNLE